MIEVTDINDPRIARYRSLRYTPDDHKRDKVFVAEGFKVVKRLLECGLTIESVFAEGKYYDFFRDYPSINALNDEQKLTADKSVMEQITGFRLHTGIMAIALQPQFTSLDELKPPLVLLNGIVDAENVGSIVRNCAAFGIESLVFDLPTANPYLRRAVRVSMGAVFSMKLHNCNSLVDVISRLKSKGYSVFSAETGVSAESLNKVDFPLNSAIIFGSEGKGISAEILNICDKIIEIPITGKVNSLNVTSATAIFLFEIAKSLKHNRL